jgi:hypothetical protein
MTRSFAVKRFAWLVSAWICLSLAGCSADSSTGGGGGPGQGNVSGSGASGNGAGSGGDGFGNGNAGTLGTGNGGTGAGGDGVLGDACASVTVDAKVDVKPGNLLVIFDRSQSMNSPFDTPTGPQPKYIAAGAALVDALEPLACPPAAMQSVDDPCSEALTVGAILFPTNANCLLTPGGGVDPIESAENIDFQPVGKFIDSWAAYWMNHPLVLSTPIDAAFTVGATAIHRQDLVGNKAVVLFTDGEPTCPITPGAKELAGMWAGEGIKTYVVGLPGANGVQTLRNIAMMGGTMDYITPTDSKVLTDALKKIIVETAGFDSCTFTINGKIVDATAACGGGKVKLDGQDIMCDPQNGFAIDNPTHITFHGAACDALKASSGRLEAMFPCNVVVPQ